MTSACDVGDFGESDDRYCPAQPARDATHITRMPHARRFRLIADRFVAAPFISVQAKPFPHAGSAWRLDEFIHVPELGGAPRPTAVVLKLVFT